MVPALKQERQNQRKTCYKSDLVGVRVTLGYYNERESYVQLTAATYEEDRWLEKTL